MSKIYLALMTLISLHSYQALAQASSYLYCSVGYDGCPVDTLCSNPGFLIQERDRKVVAVFDRSSLEELAIETFSASEVYLKVTGYNSAGAQFRSVINLRRKYGSFKTSGKKSSMTCEPVLYDDQKSGWELFEVVEERVETQPQITEVYKEAAKNFSIAHIDPSDISVITRLENIFIYHCSEDVFFGNKSLEIKLKNGHVSEYSEPAPSHDPCK